MIKKYLVDQAGRLTDFKIINKKVYFAKFHKKSNLKTIKTVLFSTFVCYTKTMQKLKNLSRILRFCNHQML